MKKAFLLLMAIGILSVSGLVLAKHIWRGETMSLPKANQRWGAKDFNKEQFKTGDYTIRSSMAASILKQKKIFFGKTPTDIRNELGSPDGFYFTDMYPAYMVDMTPNDSWQIVFLLNKEHKISDLIIHKNCCDK